MNALIIAVLLSQNTNQGPIMVQQNGNAQSVFRAITINCQAGLSCAQSGTTMTINALGSDGGSIATNLSGVAPVVTTSDGGNGYAVSLTVPSCTAGGSALQYSSGVFSCAVIDGGSLSTVTASSPLVATPDGGKGVDISFPTYQTSGALALYLDPAGSDSNTCTTVGAPCLTPNGVVAKIPRFVKSAVTVTVAAGTYAGVSMANVNAESSIVWTGAQGSFTVATGSNSGTFTAVSSNGLTALSVLTDSTQTWTVNNLRGRFITISSVRYPIVSNTATTISLATPLSPVPSIGAAYTITTPSVIFNAGSGTALSYQASGVGSVGAVSFTDIEFTSTGVGLSVNAIGGLLTLTSCRVVGTTSAVSMGTFGFSTPATFSRSYFEGGGTGTVNTSSISLGTYFRLSSYMKVIHTRFSANTSWAFEATANNNLVVFAGAGNGAMNEGSFFAICTPATSQRGVILSTNTTNTLSSSTGDANPNGVASFANLTTTGCQNPVVLQGPGAVLQVIGETSLGGDSTGVALTISRGARAKFQTLPTTSSVTSDVSIDGDSFTFGDVNALSPKYLSNGATLSSVSLQP